MRLHVHVHCVCGRKVQEPVYRLCGLDVRAVHHRGGRTCRIAIVPDPAGHDHRVWTLPSGMSLEDGIRWAHERLAHLRRLAA